MAKNEVHLHGADLYELDNLINALKYEAEDKRNHLSPKTLTSLRTLAKVASGLDEAVLVVHHNGSDEDAINEAVDKFRRDLSTHLSSDVNEE